MENYISLLIALLENLGHFTEKEAEKLVEELKNTTLSAQYKGMSHTVKDILEKVRKK